MAEIPPLSTSQPEYAQQIRNKYSELVPALRQRDVSDDHIREVIRYDVERVRSGRKPLTKKETAYGVAALQQGKPVAPEPEERSASLWSIPGNFLRDIADFATSLPRLPEAIRREGAQIEHLIRGEDVPLADENVVAKVASMPGVRLIPGAYVTEQIAKGEPSELVRHPGFAALDVLPLKGPVKKLPGVAPALAKVKAPISAWAETSPLAQKMSTTIGPKARELGRTQSDVQARVERAWNPEGGDIGTVVKDQPADFAADLRLGREIAVEAKKELSKIPEQRRVEIGAERQRPGQPGDPYAELNLTGEERAAMARVDELTAKSAELLNKRGLLPQYEGPGIHGGEYFTAKDYGRLARTDRKIAKASELADSKQQLLLDILAPHLDDPRIRGLIDNIKDDMPRARRQLARWEKGEGLKRRPLPPTLAVSRVRALTADVAKARQYAARRETFKTQIMPARWQPMIIERQKAALGKMAEERIASTTELDDARALIEDGLPELIKDAEGNPLFTRPEMSRLYREMRSGWGDLKRAGYDPVFQHRVRPGQATSVKYAPRVVESLRKPGMVKDRTMDMSPAVDDFSVALQHQGLEHLKAAGNQRFVDAVVENGMFGVVPAAELNDVLMPIARARAARHPTKSAGGILGEMRDKRYVEFRPESVLGVRRAGPAAFTSGRHMMPKEVASALERMKKNYMDRPSVAVFDAATGVFRTSVLALSPRWQTTNILGGLIMTAINQPSAFAEVFNARRMLKEGKAPVGIGTSMSREMKRMNFEAGQNMGRVAKSAAADRVGRGVDTVYDKTVWGLDKTTQPVRVVARKMFDANAYMDDMFRSMNYLRGSKHALRMVDRRGGLMDYQMPAKVRGKLAAARKGTPEQKSAFAEEEGLRLARRVLQTFDDMTPVERDIIRFVFPFYGWARHVVRFAYQYAVDHPVRVEITSKLLQQELEDWESGLPRDFIAMFRPPWAEEDEEGNVSMVDTRAFNPFAGYDQYFTLAGFVQSLNPAVSTPLEYLGVDPMTGEASLYGDAEYDPQTGHLRRTKGNLPTMFAENVVPQLGGVRQALGLSPEAEELARASPEAAGRRLLSAFGVPQYRKQYNLSEKVLQAETTRLRAYRDQVGDALRTGSYRRLERLYPRQARDLQQKLRRLQDEGALKPYTLSESRNAIALAQDALKAQIGR